MQRLNVLKVVVVAVVLGSFLVVADAAELRIAVQDGSVVGGKTLTSFGSTVAVNDHDDVAYTGSFFEGGNFRSGIFTLHQGFLVGQGDTLSGKTLVGFGVTLDLNNRGTVVFLGAFQGGTGIFSQNAQIVGTGDQMGKFMLLGTVAGVVNDRREVAYIGTFLGGNGIFSTRQGFLAGTGKTIQGKQITLISGGLSLNDRGGTVFAASFAPDLTIAGIFTPEKFIAGVGHTLGDCTVTRVANPQINTWGEILFFAACSDGRSGLYSTWRGWVVRTGDTFSGKNLVAIFDQPALNVWGEIAFAAHFEGGSGIFTTYQGLVAASGDMIEGKTLLGFTNPALNNIGTLAFHVVFNDMVGSEAIVLSSPRWLSLAQHVQ